MQIETTNSVLGWYYGNRLLIENRKEYKFDTGNNVTVIERRMINVQLYNEQGVVPATFKGTHLDLMV